MLWQYDEEKGEVKERHGKPLRRIGKPMCATTIGCPKGTPDNPKTLSPKNEQAYSHYLRCRAVGQFPDDSIVRRNAAIIRAVEDAIERSKRDELLLYLRGMVRGAFVR